MTEMLLEWVITSIFLILTVLVLRAAFGRRVSARLRYALWAVVLIRLLVPVQLFASPLAGTRVFSESRAEQTVTQWPITSDARVPSGPGDGVSLSLPDESLTDFPAAPEAPGAPEAPAAPDLTKVPAFFGWIWLGGSIALALVLAASNLRFALRLRRSRIPLEGADCPLPVYAAEGLPSPCLFGLIRPAVYVTRPAAADPAMLRHVVTHEYTHFRQGDHLWSFLRCAALAVHWWNPLVWLAVNLSRRDGELACDEGALKRLGDGERLAYGNTLLALVTAKPGPGDLLCFATTMAGEKKSLKERVSRIAQAPKRWLWAAVAVVLATALACACAFGSTEEPASPDPDPAGTPDLTDDLSFSLDENEEGTVVRINGSVDGVELEHASWFYYTLFNDTSYPPGWLLFEMPLCDNAVVCWLDACWMDESRTVVRVSAAPRAMISSYSAAGNLIFTVDLSKGTLLELEGYIPKLSPNEPERVPTEAEAVRTARIAARLLTGAEDYYRDHSGLQAVYTIAAGDGSGAVRIEGLGDAHVEWSGPDTSISGGGWLYFTNPVFCCPRLAGRQVEGSAMWADEDRTSLAVVMSAPDDVTLLDSDPPKLYVYFTVELDSGTVLARDVQDHEDTLELTDREMADMARILAKLLTGAEDYYQSHGGLSGYDPAGEPEPDNRDPQSTGVLTAAPDLNRDGIPETVHIMELDGGMGQRLSLWNSDYLLWSDEGYYAHAGWNAVFLCTLDGKDYLLRYHPYMGQGWCEYSYELFTLTRDGKEQVIRQNSIEFDINFDSAMHESFDPEAIAAFMDEINGLLANSVQLINTDDDLLRAFQKEGRLYDSLWWLDIWEPVFERDESVSLLENLRAFQACMEEDAAGH